MSEHIKVNRHLLPEIDQFCFRMDANGRTIIIRIDDKYREYFGVAKYLAMNTVCELEM